MDETEDDNLPVAVRRLHRYLEDVEFECIQELFAQLASWSPSGEWSAWPPNDDVNDVMVLIARFDLVDTIREATPPPPDVCLQIAHAAAVLSSGSVRLARVLGSSAAATQLATQSALTSCNRLRLLQHCGKFLRRCALLRDTRQVLASQTRAWLVRKLVQ